MNKSQLKLRPAIDILRGIISLIKLQHFAISLFLILFASSCRKSELHPVPNVPVEFVINIESTLYIELNHIGGWAYFSGGYRGIIIYRVSETEFMAFDRACPVHPHDECAIIKVMDPPLATDSCCNSTFLLIDGSPVQGPSRYPLRQYRTFLDFPLLRITN